MLDYIANHGCQFQKIRQAIGKADTPARPSGWKEPSVYKQRKLDSSLSLSHSTLDKLFIHLFNFLIGKRPGTAANFSGLENL